MVRQVLDALFPPAPQLKTPRTLVDCTLGRGGHALAVTGRLTSADTLLALDRDPRNLDFARKRFEGTACAVRLFEANFAQLGEVLDAAGVPTIDGLLADLGVSTNQLMQGEYGLSFAADGPLDMRLSPDESLSAETIVNGWEADAIADVLYNLADERYSRRIARKIVEERLRSPIKTSGRLADIVRAAVPRVPRFKSTESIDPATRTFLALRMAVNREAENLASLLAQAPARCAPDARLAVISFHSTEDRIVKRRFRDLEAAGVLDVLTKRPLVPDADEVAVNPRSRSSKLRVARKV